MWFDCHSVALARNRNFTYFNYLKCFLFCRFCLFETSCVQEDHFPSALCIKVNGKLCPLPVCSGLLLLWKWILRRHLLRMQSHCMYNRVSTVRTSQGRQFHFFFACARLRKSCLSGLFFHRFIVQMVCVDFLSALRFLWYFLTVVWGWGGGGMYGALSPFHAPSLLGLTLML